MLNKILLLIIFLCFGFSYSQGRLTKYSKTYNKFSFNYEFNPIKIIKHKDNNGKYKIEFENYINEAKSGEYAIPNKELYIALPAYSKVSVNIIPQRTVRIEGTPVFNPSVILKTDSSLQYNYNTLPKLSKNNTVKPLFNIKGYLWIGNYYSVHISVNQYRFNNNNIIEELKKARIQITIQNPQNIKRLQTTINNKISDVIINKKFAVELDRRYYEGNNKNTAYDWINFNTTYLKLGVAADGVYRISKKDLENFNISASTINPQNFNLITKGKTVPIFVKGEIDGAFDNNDYIEFFGNRNWGDNYREISQVGEPYKNYLDRYSDTTVYWLTWDPSLIPNRIDSLKQFSVLPQDTVKYYKEIFHYERDNYLDFSIPSLVDRQSPEWQSNETWILGLQGLGTGNRLVTVHDVYPNTNTKAFFKIQSFASDGFVGAHKIGLSINNDPTVYDSLAFNKYQQRVVTASFNSNLLSEGNNTLKTISFPTNTTINSIAVDWYEVEYPRYLKAINDSLKFKFTDQTNIGFKNIKVTNINSNNIIVYKFSNELKRVTNYKLNQNEIIFADSIKQGDTYYLISENKIQKPTFFYTKQFEDLSSNSIQAEYILITHPKFMQKSNEYLSFINSQYKVNTKLINVNDIYDQFNYGFFSPEPIREFLHTAYLNWQSPKPKFVFLVGDASYDYYGNKEKYFSAPRQLNYVPSFGHPVSDTWFTIWDSTGALIPQMNISRLPINTIEEYDRYFNVHKDYVSKPFTEFNKKYLLFSSGQNNNPFELSTLKAANDFVETDIIKPPPTGGIVRHLYKITNPIRNFGPFTNDQVEKYIGEGGVFISYIGHSGVQIWDNGISSPIQLKNVNGNHSLISDWGCSTGKFAEPDIKAFAELFIGGPDGEAINYNGNSSLGFTSTATLFPKIFYSKILKDSVYKAAEAHTLSKIDLIQQYGASTVNKIFVLCNTMFGDPIVSLKVPPKPNLKITDNDITFNSSIIDDSKDSISVMIDYSNLGLVDTKNFTLQIKDDFSDSTIFNKSFTKQLPLQTDSLQINIPVKKLAGIHRLTVILDTDNKIDELNENDNTAAIDINVVSASIRNVLPFGNYNQVDGTIRFLNPTNNPIINNFEVEAANNLSFNNSQTFTIPFDTFYTDVNLKQYFNNGRVWIRSKLMGNNFGNVRTFIVGDKNNILFDDSLSYSSSNLNNVKIKNNTIQLDSAQANFKIISGGFNDGNAIVIQKDNQDYVTFSTLRGHFVVLFNNDDLSFVKDYHFDIFANASLVTDYINLLDTLDNSYLVLIGVKDEGAQNLSVALRNKIKEFGSVFIDSLGFRNSWAFMGRKGATPGSVPEAFKRVFEGRATIDTSINFRYNSGYLISSILGPVSKWKNILTDNQIPTGTSISYKPIGIKSSGEIDTLSALQFVNNTADLSSIDSKLYPQIKILAALNSSKGIASPLINKHEINYDKLPELGINFQTISFNVDTVNAGENINFNFSVVNAGYSIADSVEINVIDKYSSNDTTTIMNKNVNISANSKKEISVNFKTNEKLGEHNLIINVDRNSKINELFKDNNLSVQKYFVKADSAKPELLITFNGSKILDDDFVSAKPNIKIQLNSSSTLPITDTSVVSISLNDKPVYFSGNTNQLTYNFNSSNPKIEVDYKPILKNGRYTLKVTGKGNSSSFANSVVKEENFIVSNSLQLLDVYNYPNPFSGSTYFTFKLSQIPDELKIKIFTIAGRVVRIIDLKSSSLNFDFNRIFWDGRDQDGDLLANGVYLYKIITQKGSEVKTKIQKLAIVR